LVKAEQLFLKRELSRGKLAHLTNQHSSIREVRHWEPVALAQHLDRLALR
jgi:hypothetical protein